jgi:hypothetical protein
MQTQNPQPAKAKRSPIPDFPPEFQAEKILKLDSPQLVAMLEDPQATYFQKSKACMRLAQVGTKEAVPVLAGLLKDEQLAHYARFAMVPIPDPSVDDAFRAAMGTLKSKLQIGVINSVGQREDAKAVAPLTKLMYSTDVEVSKAAAAALARISGPLATAALRDGLAKTKDPVRTAVAESCLVCAEGLLKKDDVKGALALYNTLSRPDMPKTVRLAAMHSTIEVETSLKRPRVEPTSTKK